LQLHDTPGLLPRCNNDTERRQPVMPLTGNKKAAPEGGLL